LRLSPALENLNIGYQKRGVLLPRSVQFQRSLSPRSAQGVQSKGRRGWTTEAGAPPRDYGGEPDSMLAVLPSRPAFDRRDDKYLMQRPFSFSFSSLNAHCAVVGCRFFLRKRRFGSDLAPFILAVQVDRPLRRTMLIHAASPPNLHRAEDCSIHLIVTSVPCSYYERCLDSARHDVRCVERF
jgi:hypothetical protein